LANYTPVYTYTVHDFPALEKRDCEEVAFDLGKKLQNEFGVSVVRTYCNWDDIDFQPSNTWTIELNYRSEAPLRKVSTLTSVTVPGLSGLSSYKDKESCEVALAKETSFFKYKTGLIPFIYYCKAPIFVDSYFPDSIMWGLNIVSFGNPAKEPFITSLRLPQPPTDIEKFGQNVSEFFSNVGAEVVQTSSKSDFGFFEFIVRYYGNDRMSPLFHEIAKYESVSACEGGKQEVEDSVDSEWVECLGNEWEARLGLISTNVHKYRVYQLQDLFKSRKQCEENIAREVESYRSYGKDIMVGVCYFMDSRSGFGISLLEKGKIYEKIGQGG
jgi:hypothetical protein